MKEKIIAAIKAKWPAVNLTKKRLDEISAKLESKVTDENEIDAKLDEFNEYNPVAEIAKTDDAFANLQNKLKNNPTPPKKKDPKKQDGADDANDDDGADDNDEPAWVKKYIQPLVQEVQNLKKDKVVGTIKSKVSEKLKEIPADYYSEWALPEDEEGLDAFVEKVNTKYTAFQQTLSDKGFSQSPRPLGGSGGAAAKVDNDVVEFAKKQNEKVNTKN